MSRTSRKQQHRKYFKRDINRRPLKPIPYDDQLSHFVLSSDTDFRDEMYTHLMLDDYDWMVYKLKTFFNTRDYGKLTIEFEYSGGGPCEMHVIQEIENKIYAHKIYFDSDIFEEHIKVFMRKHIEHWGNKQPFNGLDVAVGFYNGVLENFTKYELKKCSPDDNVYDNRYFWYLSYW